MHPITFRFERPLEIDFRRDYARRSLRVARIALLIALPLWCVFGVLDWVVTPEVVRQLWMIRFGIVLPLIAGVTLLSFLFRRSFEAMMQPALGIMALAAGLGIVVMIRIAAGRDQHLYYAGLILVTMFAYTFVRLRFIPATIVSWSIVLAYELTAWRVDIPTAVMVSNNFFFVTANIIGMAAAYAMEHYARREFMYRRQLQLASAAAHKELQRVADLQRSLLPPRPPAIPGLSICVHYATCEMAGGDMYDFVPLCDQRRWIILIGDVAGHGASAAVIMAMAQSILRAYDRIPSSPCALMTHLNQQICKSLRSSFITAFLAIYDPLDRSFAYCRAGHQPPLLRSNGVCESLNEAASLPLGVVRDEEYLHARTLLCPGQLLLLYTDGVSEATDPAGVLFGIQRVQRGLSACDGTPQGAVRELVRALRHHQQHRPRRDDQTILAIQAV